MDRYARAAEEIPWASLGRETAVARAGNGLLPVGCFPFDLPPHSDATPWIDGGGGQIEEFLKMICGTAIQARAGILVTAGHVIEAIARRDRPLYYLSRIRRPGIQACIPYPAQTVLRYLDPRTKKANPGVDLAVIISVPRSLPELPYEGVPIEWGDSREAGVGDAVIVGGYPLGGTMFLLTRSNRGIVQPTFYSGIISAVLPATNPKETRLLQVSIASSGGISGGVVLRADDGKAIGMVTSGVDTGGAPLPITWAIPSEVIVPYVEAITFSTGASSE